MFSLKILALSLFWWLANGGGYTWQAFYRNRDAVCTEQTICNGDMCADVCELGSVKVDEWSQYVLTFQRWLQLNTSLLSYQFPGTHNSHISVAYGFGIERDYISSLHDGKELDWGGGDLKLGEGVDQYLSVYDQLNMGIRHIEIDINWGPWVTNDTGADGIIVCHTPVIDPLIEVQLAEYAFERDVSLDNFDIERLDCRKTHVLFNESMKEIKSWLDSNPDNFIIIYFDTKWDILEEQAEWGTNNLIAIFGDLILTPDEKKNLFNDTWPSMYTLMYKYNKHILIENVKPGWSKPSNNIVFTPPIWDGLQFGPLDLNVYPDCTIDGNFSYNRYFSRALDDTVPDSTNLERQYRDMIDISTRCGVNIVSPHMINPYEMKYFIWTFENQKQPNSNYSCVAMKRSGRWATYDCNTQFRVACLNSTYYDYDNDQVDWYVTSEKYDWNTAKNKYNTICNKTNYVFDAPRDGFSNAKLQVQALTSIVWLNVNMEDFQKWEAMNR